MLYETLSRARPSPVMRGTVSPRMMNLQHLERRRTTPGCPRRPGPSLLIIRPIPTRRWVRRGPGRANGAIALDLAPL